MRRFLIRTITFSGILCIFFFLYFLLANGTSDPYYLKFTGPKSEGLIVGSSRAGQGIRPFVVDSVLAGTFPGIHLYNYSFMVHIAYGPAYFRSIVRKLDQNQKNGVFIVAVDPWMISTPSLEPEDSTAFPENKLFINDVLDVNMRPNLFYLVRSYPKPYYRILQDRYLKTNTFLHDDGWLEVKVSPSPDSLKSVISRKVATYTPRLITYNFSKVRYNYLRKIINEFKTHGDVYLVQLPLSPEMRAIDYKLYPEFDGLMIKLSREFKLDYFNFADSSDRYSYIDGNHLDLPSSKKFSIEIGKLIKQTKQESIAQ